MCGIVGYVGKRQVVPILLDGLEKLEYRGYDSAGICVHNDSGLVAVKTKGRLSVLCDWLKEKGTPEGTVGIGHTRWATHGAPSDLNSHPHLSDSGEIAVVHNGIIENESILRQELLALGCRFQSETDTEVVANLIGWYYRQERDFEAAVRKTVARLEGSFAMGILCTGLPGTMIAVKKASPLIFGFGNGENYVASDVPAILKHTRTVAYLDDGDMVIFTDKSVRFTDFAGNVIQKKQETITWEMSAAERGGYAHFMLKEIHEQPKALKDTIAPRIREGKVYLGSVCLDREYLQGLRKIYLIACGSAYYVSVLAKYTIEKICRISTEAVLASEFRYGDPVVGQQDLVIAVSQSGETADTLAALREAKRRGARTLAIVNVVGSAVAKEADEVLYTWAGPEIAVATTKAFSTQLAVIYLLALHMAEQLNTISSEEYDKILTALERLPEDVEKNLTEEKEALCRKYAQRCAKRQDAYFIGRNVDSAVCLEGSLKMKEVAYIHCEAYPAGELKHGPISMVEEGTLVLAVATVESLFDKTISNVREVEARGAEVLYITMERLAQHHPLHNAITVTETHPLLQPSLCLIPLQMLAYYTAVTKGCDVDKPRNLAKSVTVE